jgi:gamma-glutamyl-gamma-aminobutyrate hydrolase PuuD
MIIAISTNNTGRKSETPGRSQNSAYVKYVDNAGFTPILVPMEANTEDIVNISDGLLMPGGIDIDPIYYGYSNQASFAVDPDKDAHERELFHAFRSEGKPIFGICRGFQLIAREFIHAEWKQYGNWFDYIENIGHHSQTGNLNLRRDIPSHQVRCKKQVLYGEGGKGMTLIPVNSMHHQCLSFNYVRHVLDTNYPEKPTQKELINLASGEPKTTMVGKHVEVLAWSMRGVSQPGTATKPDYENYWSIVEAFKLHNWGAPIMGVQWHPEELMDVRIIRNFFDGEQEVLGKQGSVGTGVK